MNSEGPDDPVMREMLENQGNVQFNKSSSVLQPSADPRMLGGQDGAGSRLYYQQYNLGASDSTKEFDKGQYAAMQAMHNIDAQSLNSASADLGRGQHSQREELFTKRASVSP